MPTVVPALGGMLSVCGADAHTFAIRASDGSVWGCGGNVSGALGDGTESDRHSPVRSGNLTNVVKVSALIWATGALRSDGTVWMWGAGARGTIGNGLTEDEHTPVQVDRLSNITDLAVGWGHTLSAPVKTAKTSLPRPRSSNETIVIITSTKTMTTKK